MRIDKQTIVPVVGVFLLFFAISGFIFFSGKRLHEPGEGLSESVNREYIVQYFVRVRDGVKVDAKASAPAARAQVGGSESLRVRLRNLEAAAQELRWSVRVKPENGERVEFPNGAGATVSLAPGQETEVMVPYRLRTAELETKDGTLDFEFQID